MRACVCVGGHASRHKAVWDLGSGVQLLYPQRGRVEPEKEVECLNSHSLTPVIQLHCKLNSYISICLSLSRSYPPFITFYHRVEAVCPRVAELNPYVHVDMSSSALDDNTDLSFLRKYQVSCYFSASGLWPTHGIVFPLDPLCLCILEMNVSKRLCVKYTQLKIDWSSGSL